MLALRLPLAHVSNISHHTGEFLRLQLRHRITVPIKLILIIFSTECHAGDSQFCNIPHGQGYQSCNADLFYSACLVETCDTGYTMNSNTNTCTYQLNYSLIVAIVSGCAMIIILSLGTYCWNVTHPFVWLDHLSFSIYLSLITG
jgi:hypothetical protein